MTISESQLKNWANQGGTTAAEDTHKSIRYALRQYNWPNGVEYEDYLQGSYRNFTNIYVNSDVDLVVELVSTFYHNPIDEASIKAIGFSAATYEWGRFRQDVINALIAYYGSQYIDTSGGKSVKVLPNNGRLKGDVVVAAKYKYYDGARLVAEGITFWNTKNGQQIVNYPKRHFDNGSAKNANTSQWYKPAIRMFKNAREQIYKNKSWLAGKFPSYFVECLLYNVPNSKFGVSYQDIYCNLVNWLEAELDSNPSSFVCQNEMFYLFGSDSVQWNGEDAKLLANEWISLWNS
jgi:hypothetical protein